MKKIHEFLIQKYFLGWIGLLLSLVIFPTIIFMNIKTKIHADDNMSQSEMIGHLMNEISTLDSRFSSEITWMLTILSLIGIIVGFYSYQQWKLSENAINRIEDRLANDFGINQIHKLLDKTKKNYESQKTKQDALKKDMNKDLKELNILLETTRKENYEIKKNNFSISLGIISTLFESMKSQDASYHVRNTFIKLNNLLSKNKDLKINDNYIICNSLTGISNGLDNLAGYVFDDDDKESAYNILNDSAKIVLNMIDINNIDDDDKYRLKRFINLVKDLTGEDLMPEKIKDKDS